MCIYVNGVYPVWLKTTSGHELKIAYCNLNVILGSPYCTWNDEV